MASGARSQRFFGQFRGLFKEFRAKRGGCAPPAPPPSGSAPVGVCANLERVHINPFKPDFTLSSSSTTSRELLSQFSTCSG